jgi:hypothetical protein
LTLHPAFLLIEMRSHKLFPELFLNYDPSSFYLLSNITKWTTLSAQSMNISIQVLKSLVLTDESHLLVKIAVSTTIMKTFC